MDIENTNQSQIPIQNPGQSQPTLSEDQPSQSKKTIIILAIIVAFLAFGVGGYILGTRNGNLGNLKPFNSSIPLSPTSTTEATISSTTININKVPQMAAFMRNGEIWIKDFTTSQEKKISKTAKVESPIFSPSGKHLYYFKIVHAGGGFPRYSLFVSDAQGKNEKTFTEGANHYASKLMWSSDGQYLGMILFGNDIPGGANYFEEAFIYNTQTQKEVSIGKLTKGTSEGDEYLVNTSCDRLQSQYVTFCKEYTAYIAVPRKNEYKGGYKSEEFKNSKYTKPNYRLTKSEKLDNGLVVLEYYTGEPQNPEATGGWVAGPAFVPGYDQGVTETYTILLDESTGKVITEISLAIDTNFIF